MPEEDEVLERSLAARVFSYGQSLRRWIAAGRPIRTDAEVQQIYSELCEPCAYFGRHQQSCKICGCQVRSSGTAFTNKIRMATEHCPKGQW